MKQMYYITEDEKAIEQNINLSDEQCEIFAENNDNFIYQNKVNAIKLKAVDGVVVADEEAIHAYHLDKTQKKLTELVDEKTLEAYGIIAKSTVTKYQEGRYDSKLKVALENKEFLALEAELRGAEVDDLAALISAKEAPFNYAKQRFDILIEAFKTGVNMEREKESPDWSKVYQYLLFGENIGKGITTPTVEVFDAIEQSIRDLFIGDKQP